MRFIFQKRADGQIEFGIIYGGIALLALLADRFFPFVAIAPSCLLKELTGVACPTCGSTRAVSHLSHGEFMAAFALNPLITLSFIGAMCYFIYSVVTLVFDMSRVAVIRNEKESKLFRAAAFFLVIAQWSYLVFRI